MEENSFNLTTIDPTRDTVIASSAMDIDSDSSTHSSLYENANENINENGDPYDELYGTRDQYPNSEQDAIGETDDEYVNQDPNNEQDAIGETDDELANENTNEDIIGEKDEELTNDNMNEDIADYLKKNTEKKMTKAESLVFFREKNKNSIKRSNRLFFESHSDLDPIPRTREGINEYYVLMEPIIFYNSMKKDQDIQPTISPLIEFIKIVEDEADPEENFIYSVEDILIDDLDMFYMLRIGIFDGIKKHYSDHTNLGTKIFTSIEFMETVINYLKDDPYEADWDRILVNIHFINLLKEVVVCNYFLHLTFSDID